MVYPESITSLLEKRIWNAAQDDMSLKDWILEAVAGVK